MGRPQNIDTKHVGADIPTELAETFSQQCRSRGFVIGKVSRETAKGSDKKEKMGLYLKPDVKAAYTKVCRGRISDGLLGAAIVWIGLPADIRETAMTNGKNLSVADAVAITRKALMTRMTDLEIEEAVRAMPKTEKVRFLKQSRDRPR